MNREILRILDANVNRAVEGVRVLEEAARMLFNDTALTDELKDLRHGIARILPETKGVGSRLILARDSEGDVLREGEISSERTRTDVSSVIRANARRACEAVRSLEEYGKLVDSSLSGRYKRVRFRLYDLEKKLMERVFRQKLLSARRLGVWVIIDHGELGGLAAHLAETAVEAGAGTIVFRDKASSDRMFLSHAEPLVTACSAKDTTILVNDRVDAAVMLGADGVVLGKDDTPLALARSLVGGGMLVGRSVGTPDYRHPKLCNAQLGDPSSIIRGPLSWIGACPPESMESADFLLLAAGWERRSLGEVIRDSPAPVIASFVPNKEESGDILDAGVAGISLYAEQYRPDDLAGAVACMRKEFEHRNQ